jgi:hypothetical protein
MSSIVYNKSKTYLLPLISEIIDIDPKYIDHLENTYMEDSKGEYKNCIFIYQKFNFKNPDFTKYENKLVNNELFVKLIDKGEYTIYIFKFPEEYLPEYEFLKQSKYSWFGNDAKQLIIRFWKELYGQTPVGGRVVTKIKQILYKDKILKKELEKMLSTEKSPVIIDDNSELGEYVDMNNETIDLYQ